MKPINKTKTKWSSNLAYCVGLIATDGCLYKDGRHLAFISKDLDLIHTFQRCLGIKVKIAKKRSGFKRENFVYWIQFGDVIFYRFLVSIGLSPAKSKTIGELHVPDKYFFDFLRGSFDGDGTFYSYWDKRWASSFMFYLVFISASLGHLEWIQKTVKRILELKGHFNLSGKTKTYQLKYSKHEALIILKEMYKNHGCPTLERKRKKVYNALAINVKV